MAPGEVAVLNLEAHDPDCADTCTDGCGTYIRSDLFSFSADGGTILSTEAGPSGSPFSASGQWQAPATEGVYTITAYVADSGGFMCGGRGSVSPTLEVSVSLSSNQAPVIDSLTADRGILYPGETAQLQCTASDPDGDPLTYEWQSNVGAVVPLGDGAATFSSAVPGLATITCTARDVELASGSDTLMVSVSAVLAEKGLGTGLVSPQGLAVDSMGDVFVADPGRGGIVVLNLFSNQEVAFLPMAGIVAVDVDGADNLLVGARSGAWLMNRHGEVLLQFDSDGDVADVAVNQENQTYGVLRRRSARVKVYDPTGALVVAFGSAGDGPGQVKSAMGLAVTPAGGYWQTPHWLVTDAGHGEVKVFEAGGAFVGAMGALGGGAGEFVSASGVAVGPDDLVYVSDAFQSWVQAFNPDGTLREAFGGHGDDLGQFRTAAGIAVVPEFDRLLVASVNGRRLQVFTITADPVAEGPSPLPSWSPAALDFGDVELGANASLSTVLANLGGAPMGIGTVTVEGEFLVDHDCPPLLDPAQSCTFTVTFSPVVMGPVNGVLSVETSTGSEALAVPISGYGLVPPTITLTPPALDFGLVEVGETSAVQLITLVNQGPATLSVYGVQVDGPYTMTHDCGAQIASSDSCTVQVRFAPLTVGAGQAGTISVLSNGLGAPHLVSLSGEGIPVETLLWVSDQDVQESAGEAIFTVSLSSPSASPVTVQYATQAGSALEGEDYLAATGTLTVPAGEVAASITVAVVDDGILEPLEEQFTLQLSAAVNAVLSDAEAVGTISDDETCLSPNLLVNGSAEYPVSGNSIPGWTAVEGVWLPEGPEPAPVDGDWYFSPDGSALAQVEQIVDVTRFMAASPEPLAFRFTGALRTADAVSQDSARIQVEYLHAATGAVLDAWDSGEVVSPLAWVEVLDERVAPAETGWVRVRLTARRVDGDTNDGIFDDLQLSSLRLSTLVAVDGEGAEGAAGEQTVVTLAAESNCLYNQDILVDYATASGSATDGVDFIGDSGQLVVQSGTDRAELAVSVFGDDADEGHEEFFLHLNAASPETVVIVDNRASGRIVNDDFCPQKAAYWKKHTWLWPVTQLDIGFVTYQQDQLVVFLDYTGQDESMMVARELTAMKLNLAAGSDPTVDLLVTEGDDYLASFPPGSDPDGTAREWGRDLSGRLHDYNTRKCE